MKKIFIFIILIISQFILGNNVFSAQIPIEKVFSDINKNYKYYNELQALYDKGMIFPDENGKFNPRKLLNRDEFVGISMEVSCKKCIAPNTDLQLLKDYSKTQIFYDVSKKNKYYYCIAEADAKNYVKGYDKGHICENNIGKKNKRPFCVDNKITLEEALAVILRNSGIFTIEDNKKVIKKIYSGEITENLSDDVSPKNNLGQVYTFYGYLKKALNFKLKEVDKDGNEKIYRLLKKTNNKIYPYKHISKEEFLRIAYVALKSNSCNQQENFNLALEIEILNKSCKEGIKCNKKIFNPNEDTFDLDSKIGGVCKKGVDNKNYKWTFFNINSGTEIKKVGKYIDNYRFLEKGKWRVILNVKDNCGNKSKAYSTIFIQKDNKGLNVQINANPIIGNYKLNVQFDGIISGGNGQNKYEWDFGDGTKSYGKNPKHIFKKPGVYKVNLIVTDKNGNTGEATIIIKVLDFDSCELDEDKDGIMDCNDILPKIPGSNKNNGAPILENSCNSDCSCQEGYECTIKDKLTCEKGGVCVPKKISINKCLENGYNSFIYGKAICNSCPCNYFLDFNATLRKCDLVFPAITSIDSKNIFSRGNVYKIQ